MDKSKFSRLFGLITIVIVVFCANAYATDPAYIQLSSNTSQIVSKAKTTQIVNWDSQDSSPTAGVIWSKDSPGKIIVEETGVYFMMASGQGGIPESTKNPKGGPKGGDVSIWFELNGKPVAASANSQFIFVVAKTKGLATQMILSLKKGDTLAVGYTASEESLGLIAFPQASYRPLTPSISLSMFKID